MFKLRGRVQFKFVILESLSVLNLALSGVKGLKFSKIFAALLMSLFSVLFLFVCFLILQPEETHLICSSGGLFAPEQVAENIISGIKV